MNEGIIKRNSINECENDNIKLMLLLLFVWLNAFVDWKYECFCGLKNGIWRKESQEGIQ